MHVYIQHLPDGSQNAPSDGGSYNFLKNINSLKILLFTVNQIL